jgi:hypothetical protein
MLSLLTLQRDCIRDYRRYADTVAVLSAVYHILKEDPTIVDYIGIEKNLKNSEGKDIEPDLVALYDHRTKGLLFEFKWSLPLRDDLLEKEIKELRKYNGDCSLWKSSNGRVDYHDSILVCHIEDSERSIEKFQKVASEKEYNFLNSDGFAIWTWIISSAREGERKEHLMLSNVHGKIRYAKIEGMIKRPTGLILPEESLTYLRSTFNFIHDKPPIQYTIIKLIQHVFPQFQDYKRGVSVYEITTDMIYKKANILFPSWKEQDVQTIQVKRKWITEALEAMFALKIIGKPIGKPDSWLIPIPTLKTRKPIEEALCVRLAKYQLKITKPPRRKGRQKDKPIRFEASPKIKKLTDFM